MRNNRDIVTLSMAILFLLFPYAVLNFIIFCISRLYTFLLPTFIFNITINYMYGNDLRSSIINSFYDTIEFTVNIIKSICRGLIIVVRFILKFFIGNI